MAQMKRINQTMFQKRINVRQMLDMVRLGAAINKTVFFYGGAGLGKSQKMQQIADIMYPHRRGNNLCDVRLSDKEPQDLAGIPFPLEMEVDGRKVVRTVYAVPSFWPTDPNWEGIVFLDELPNAIQSVQQSAYQVILDHIVGEFKFPKGAIFVGAGNRDTDNGATTELLGPLVNRMMLCEIEYDLDIWIEDFAIPYNLHPHVIGFLKQHPEYFYTGDVESRSTPVFASPRSWEGISRVLDAFSDKKNGIDEYIAEVSIAGQVGEGLDSLVMAYHIRASRLPLAEDIFSGKVTQHKLEREEVDLVYVLSQTCLRKLKDEIMDNKRSDKEVIERCGRFLKFMYENHSKGNMDTVMALVIGLFRAPAGETPILSQNPKREKMMPNLRKEVPTVMEMVLKYHSRYGDLMAQFDK